MSARTRTLPAIPATPPADHAATLPPGVVADVRSLMAGIRRVRRGLDPEQVHSLLLARAARELQLLGELRAAKEDERRAVEALRSWIAEHAPTCQVAPGRHASRIINQQAPSNYPNPPYPGTAATR